MRWCLSIRPKERLFWSFEHDYKVLQVADSAGNRISNLMLRTEEEVMQIHPQDTGTLGEVAQVVHQLAPAQLLRLFLYLNSIY